MKLGSNHLTREVGGRQSLQPNTKTWIGRQFEEEESVVAAAVVPITSYCFSLYCWFL